MTDDLKYVCLLDAPRTRIGTIAKTRMDNGQLEYLFHQDERFADKIPDFWAVAGDFEPCERPTDQHVATINALIRRD